MTTLAADRDLLDGLAAVPRAAEGGEEPPAEALAALRRYADAQGEPFEPAARDRVREELEGILASPDPRGALALLRDTGALARLVPELAPAIGFDQRTRHHDLTVDEHLLHALGAAAELGASLRVRLAMLFHDAGKPDAAWEGDDGRWHYYPNPELGKEGHERAGARLARRALARLGYPDATVEEVARLIERHMLWPKRSLGKIRELREDLGDELLDELFVHRRADTIGKAEEVDVSAAEMLADLDEMQRQVEIVRRQDAGAA
jgi:tRNA nucleotidyltransferase (CCA-adding enzyme)